MRILDWDPWWLIVALVVALVIAAATVVFIRVRRHHHEVALPVVDHLSRFEGSTINIPESMRSRFKPLRRGDPTQAGNYAITFRLGEGGMGEIFLGQTANGRLVVIKMMLPGLASDPDNFARFEREAELLRDIAGPHSTRYLDSGIAEDGRPYIVIEYIDAPNLLEVIRIRGALDPVEVARIGLFIIQGLIVFHARGVIHRDLKPANILYVAEPPRGPQVWIIDLGIAHYQDGTRITQLDIVMGTVQYMAPERLTSDEITEAADVFSFGVLLYFLCTKQLPFDADDPMESVRLVREAQPNLEIVPRKLRPVIARCLEKNPQRRATTYQVLEMLQRVK